MMGEFYHYLNQKENISMYILAKILKSETIITARAADAATNLTSKALPQCGNKTKLPLHHILLLSRYVSQNFKLDLIENVQAALEIGH